MLPTDSEMLLPVCNDVSDINKRMMKNKGSSMKYSEESENHCVRPKYATASKGNNKYI
jgi:hypothetical protein